MIISSCIMPYKEIAEFKQQQKEIKALSTS